MSSRTNEAAVIVVVLAMMVLMLITIATSGYMQYDWDVRMDNITIYSGHHLMEPIELFALYVLFIGLATISTLSYSSIVLANWPKAQLATFIVIIMAAFSILIWPVLITIAMLSPLIMLDIAVSGLGVQVNFLIKHAIVLVALLIFGLAYRIARGFL